MTGKEIECERERIQRENKKQLFDLKVLEHFKVIDKKIRNLPYQERREVVRMLKDKYLGVVKLPEVLEVIK